MRPVKDPAPSRLEYRMYRLMLRPSTRSFVRYGIPLAALVLLAGSWLASEDRRERASASLAGIRKEISERPEFAVRSMVVEGASPGLAASIRDSLAMKFPVSSFDLRLAEMKETVEALDAVAHASIGLLPKGVLTVEVDERVPAAVWRSEEGLVLLDRTGRQVATVPERASRPDLPLVAGRGADAKVPEALRLYEVAGPVRDRLRGFIRVGERRWDVILDRGQTIKLPETEAATSLERVIELDVAQDLLERDVSVVDFRNPLRPVLRLGETAAGSLLEAQAAAGGRR